MEEIAVYTIPPAETDSHVAGFLNGSSEHAYTFMGAHPVQQEGRPGWLFRVWAPKARAVSVIGSFNQWNREAAPMIPDENGIWTCFVPGPQRYDSYKFSIQTREGHWMDKADPFAFHAETRPANASKLYALGGYSWGDEAWQSYCARHPYGSSPLNIYEVHLGSWRRRGDGSYLSYREYANWLVPYVKEMGFTAVELLPLTEHPLDASWGYQCTGYFAPTSRFGSPHDFMYLVDQLHRAGVAVFMDWVPAFFPQDEHGLAMFDGTPCYEYADPQRADLPRMKASVFDFGKPPVRAFLLSSALFWLREYHLDGLRLSAVSSMLYLDAEGRPWEPNEEGGRENREAEDFLRLLNEEIHRQFPHAMLSAEVATERTGIAFRDNTFQWHQGWTHDALHYIQLDPIYRQYNHKDLTLSLGYVFSRQFLLPLSHDEVCSGKSSLIERIPGNDREKFAGARVFYLYMLTCPGKKLVMMGTEFGQRGPWRHEYSLDWHLLEQEQHRKHQAFFRDANQFYLANPPLWEVYNNTRGFQWICRDDESGNALVYLRRDKSDHELLIVLNFSPVRRPHYRVGETEAGDYRVVYHTDALATGGEGAEKEVEAISSTATPCHLLPNSIEVELPPMSGLVLARG